MLVLTINTRHATYSYICRFTVTTNAPSTEDPSIFVVKKDEDDVVSFVSIASLADMEGYSDTPSNTQLYRVSEITVAFSDDTMYSSTLASITADVQANFAQQGESFSWSESFTCSSTASHSGDFYFG